MVSNDMNTRSNETPAQNGAYTDPPKDAAGRAIHEAFASCTMPDAAKESLDQTLASITASANASAQAKVAAASVAASGAAPAVASGASNVAKTARPLHRKAGFIVAAAVAAALAVGGIAWAGSQLLSVGAKDPSYFKGESLSLYDSMEHGASHVTATVGQSVQAMGATVTVDEVSCDRNVANVYITISREGGFSRENIAYDDEGESLESDWSLLQAFVPRFDFTVSGGSGQTSSGRTRLLDAYLEDGQIKAMLRITPEQTMPDQTEITLSGESFWDENGNRLSGTVSQDELAAIEFSFGLDLSGVAKPRELGTQTLSFDTSEGAKTLAIERFTVSELACVMVTGASETLSGYAEDGRPLYSSPEDTINESMVQVTTDDGSCLQQVYAGDGTGDALGAKAILEFAGASTDTSSVTFTPYTYQETSIEEDDAANVRTVDVSQAGTQLATSEYGGYTLESRTIEGSTATLKLVPYGMTFNNSIELTLEGDINTLEGHTGTAWEKTDYATGAVSQITSYYAATKDELEALSTYRYRASFGHYQQEPQAAITLSF